MSDEKKTVLYDTHIELGAKMAPFGGYIMPIQYTGIVKEHEATRTKAALFDTCHMGEFIVQGPDSIADLEPLVTCPLRSLEDGQCRYGMLCNETGGVIDDLLVYRIASDKFMLVVNAGTQDRDFEWVSRHLSDGTQIENISAQTAKIDLQGPEAPKMMNAIIDGDISDLRYFRFKTTAYKGQSVIVSRTGYTGEVGFEIYCPLELAELFWREAMTLGAGCAGLGARDTLRLEIGMPLYGHELNETRNAAEAGFDRSIDCTKNFIGSRVVCDSAQRREALVGIVLKSRRAAREGDAILALDGSQIGTVTSGSISPSLGNAIALGYVPSEYAELGTAILLQTSRKALEGTIQPLPIYSGGTARKKLANFL
jgi:aminomethyltransferase